MLSGYVVKNHTNYFGLQDDLLGGDTDLSTFSDTGQKRKVQQDNKI